MIDKSERIPFDVAGQWTVMFDHKDLDSAEKAKNKISRAARTIRDGGEEYKADNPVTQTVDLQQLRSSGNPEQIAMAEISAALTDIRAEVRASRIRFARQPDTHPIRWPRYVKSCLVWPPMGA
jgi:hypothetical protein